MDNVMNTNAILPPVAQPIHVLVAYERRNGEITYVVKKAFKIEHGDLDQGKQDIDVLMYDSFNYWDGEKYEDRDIADGYDKKPLQPFWISHDEIMSFQSLTVISQEEFEVLIKHL